MYCIGPTLVVVSKHTIIKNKTVQYTEARAVEKSTWPKKKKKSKHLILITCDHLEHRFRCLAHFT